MKHTYRKRFDHAFEAEATAQGFRMMPNIDKVGSTEVWVKTDGTNHWVYIALEGQVDQIELLAATGYEHVK